MFSAFIGVAVWTEKGFTLTHLPLGAVEKNTNLFDLGTIRLEFCYLKGSSWPFLDMLRCDQEVRTATSARTVRTTNEATHAIFDKLSPSHIPQLYLCSDCSCPIRENVREGGILSLM